MAFCQKCGAQIEEGKTLCPACATAAQPGFSGKVANVLNTPDTTAEFDPADIEGNKVMGILAYIGILCLIPIFAAKDSKYARFHANQGLLLLIAALAWGVAYGIVTAIILAISWKLFFLIGIIGATSLVFLAAMILGIINVVNGKAKELPIIGKIRLLK